MKTVILPHIVAVQCFLLSQIFSSTIGAKIQPRFPRRVRFSFKPSPGFGKRTDPASRSLDRNIDDEWKNPYYRLVQKTNGDTIYGKLRELKDSENDGDSLDSLQKWTDSYLKEEDTGLYSTNSLADAYTGDGAANKAYTDETNWWNDEDTNTPYELSHDSTQSLADKQRRYLFLQRLLEAMMNSGKDRK